MNPGFTEIDEKTYQTAHDNAWSIPDGLTASRVLNEMGLTYIGSRILPNDYVYDFFQGKDGGWRYQTRKGLRGEGLVEMDEIVLGPAEHRKEKRRDDFGERIGQETNRGSINQEGYQSNTGDYQPCSDTVHEEKDRSQKPSADE